MKIVDLKKFIFTSVAILDTDGEVDILVELLNEEKLGDVFETMC